MSTIDAHERGSLPMLDEWLNQLSATQRNLLRAHADDEDLPANVVDLINTGRLSPMQVSDGVAAQKARTCHAPSPPPWETRWNPTTLAERVKGVEQPRPLGRLAGTAPL